MHVLDARSSKPGCPFSAHGMLIAYRHWGSKPYTLTPTPLNLWTLIKASFGKAVFRDLTARQVHRRDAFLLQLRGPPKSILILLRVWGLGV